VWFLDIRCKVHSEPGWTSTHETLQGLIFPFRGRFKKLKIRSNVAIRPILTLGPLEPKREITFLAVAEERDNVLHPSIEQVIELATRRLRQIEADASRRRRYDRR
jgi:hypothetical protein